MEVQTETAVPSAPAATPAEPTVPTTENLADFFKAEIEAERGEKPAPKAKEPEAPAIEAAEVEESPPETVDDTAQDAEPDSEAQDDEPSANPAIQAPSGFSEAEKAEYAKLPAAMQTTVSKLVQAQQADYTRKTQAVAEQRKVVEQGYNEVSKLIQHYRDNILSKFAVPELQPPDLSLRATDPDAFNDKMSEFVRLKHLEQQANRLHEQEGQRLAAIREQQMASYWAEQAQELAQLAPDLASTEKGTQLRKQVLEYARTQGYTPEILSQASARDVVTLWKAQRFDAIEKAKKSAKVVAPIAPKTVKPGPAKGVGRPTNFATAVKNLAANPSRDALAAAFAAEIASER